MTSGRCQTGYLDFATENIVTGWATRDNKPADIILSVDGDMISVVKSNHYRPDLFDNGIHPEAGFIVRLPFKLAIGQEVSVVFPDGVHLTGSPKIISSSLLVDNSDNEAKRRSLIFLHIPKTAGTSLRRSIDQAIPGRVNIYNNELSDLAWLKSFRDCAPPPLVMGHISFGVHELLHLEPRYATLIRNPLKRIVSLHRYINWLAEREYQRLRKDTLADFVESGLTEQTNNHICRIIAGIPVGNGSIIDENWLLELAMHNIKEFFDFVFDVDDTHSVCLALRQEFKVNFLPLTNENIGGGADYVVTDRDIKVFENYNRLDLELYDRLFAK